MAVKLEAESPGRVRAKQNPKAFASVFRTERQLFTHQLELLLNMFTISRGQNISW